MTTSRPIRFEGLISHTTAMAELFSSCDSAAGSSATVLISGETGTGKELLARAIHRRSSRSGRFVPLNAASVPSALFEAELFGYERGAFTGADRPKRGAVRHADGGTLFLDEIADMPAAGQVSLLRFLQEGTIRPVGAYEEHQVDVRVVAATNIPPNELLAAGKIREDLFYRLDVVELNLPPLRERIEDVELLFNHFVRRLSTRHARERPVFSESFVTELKAYHWPGNVRQLENLVERLVLSRRKRPLVASDLRRLVEGRRARRPGRSMEMVPTAKPSSSGSEVMRALEAGRDEAGRTRNRATPAIDVSRTLQEHVGEIVFHSEYAYLTEVLQRTHGRIGDAAVIAGVSRRTLLRKLDELGIDKRDFKLIASRPARTA